MLLFSALIFFNAPLKTASGLAQVPLVTVSIQPEPASKAVSDLSKAVGIKLEVSPQLRDEILQVQVKDAPVKDLLVQVAKASYADWLPNGDGYLLSRSSATANRLRLRDVSIRASEIQTMLINEARIQSNQRTKSGPAWNQSENLAQVEVVLALLQGIGAGAIAEIPPNTRAVYATHPTPAQRRLSVDPYPDSSQTLLVVCPSVRKLRAWVTCSGQNGVTKRPAQLSLALPEPRPSASPSKDSIELSDLTTEFVRKWNGRGVNPNGIPQVSTSVTMNAVEQKVLFRGSSSDSIQSKVIFSDQLMSRILNPERFDPDALVPGEAVSSCARLLNLNLVATLPDTAFRPLTTRFSKGPVSAQDLIVDIAPKAGLSVVRDHGWLTVTPQNPIESARTHVDREALGAMLRKLAGNHALSLDDMAAFCLSQDKALAFDDIDGIYLEAVSQQVGTKLLPVLDNPWPLRIYGTLTTMQKRAIRVKGPIPFSNMTPDQKRWLEFDVFNSPTGPEATTGRYGESGYGPTDPTEIDGERTQILPEGIQPDGLLSVRTESVNGYLGTDLESGISSILTANNLASQRFQRERADLAFLGTPPKYGKFQPARLTTYSFRYQLAPNVVFTRILSDTTVDRTSPSVGYDSLPQDFQADVERQLQGMRTTFKPNILHHQTPPP